LDIARAVLRLAGEHVVPVDQLAGAARASTRALIRWITQGKHGVHLDGYHKDGAGWVSSAAALERFLDATRAASRTSDHAQ
jgi:hypothetical protein